MNTRLSIKIVIVFCLTVLLSIPLMLINGVIDERENYRRSVEQDIARTWTGPQMLMGPVLALPYEVVYRERFFNKETKTYEELKKTRQKTVYLIADQLIVDGKVHTENRARGIYHVPVYSGSLSLQGHFSTSTLQDLRNKTKGFSRWLNPRLSLVIGDVRGISNHPVLKWNGDKIDFYSGSVVPNLANGIHAVVPPVAAVKKLSFSIKLDLRGSQVLRFSPMAKDMSAALESDWMHPRFDGSFLPITRTVSGTGFSANWQTSSFSTGAEKKLQDCVAGDCQPLLSMGFEVQFMESVNIYQKVTRAIKYGILFIALTFVAFFLTETLTATPLHPVQYALVGFALAMFYLLLISLSEHFIFAVSYVIATSSCALLIGVYLTGVLNNARQGLAYSLGIGLLYAMLFVILRSEDFALLMGSLLLFAMLAAIMLLTRRVDWFEVGVEPHKLRTALNPHSMNGADCLRQ